MRCPRCGNAVNPNAAQCPHCGQALRAAAPAATTIATATLATTAMEQAFEQQRKRSLTIAAIVVLALIVLGLGLRASGVLQLGANAPGDKLLTAKGTAPGTVLTQPGKTSSAPLTKSAERPVMPDDVMDWLKHLEKCEAMKNELEGDQDAEVSVWMEKNSVLGAGMGMMDPYDQSTDNEGDKEPAGYTKGKVLDLRPKWVDLITFFDSKKPPEECVPIADDFDRALNEIPGMMGDIGDILNGKNEPEQALQKLKKMQNGSYSDIDRYFQRCDQKVSAICDKYDVHKWFNIKGDVGGGGMLGAGASLPSGKIGP
jgi:predicted nucleic acid-binding Zn ribbon protein